MKLRIILTIINTYLCCPHIVTIFRKVAKVLQDDEKSKKRKSDSPISDLVAPEDVVKEKRSVMTSPVAVQSTSAQTENAAPDGGPADEGETIINCVC